MKGGGKDGSGKDAVRQFFLTDIGCKTRGADCSYEHELDGDTRARCSSCGTSPEGLPRLPGEVLEGAGPKAYATDEVKKLEVDMICQI